MKKIFVVSALMLGLASCGTQTTPDNFADLYNANVKAEMVKLDETFKTIYGTQKEANGQLSGSVFMQDVLTSNTLEFSSNFTALAGGSQMSQVTFESPKLKVETTASDSAGSGTESSAFEGTADTVDFISGMSNFMKYNNLKISATASNEEMKKSLEAEVKDAVEKLAKFNEKWVALDPNLDNAQAYELLQKLAKLQTADFEKYLTEYHVFSSTGAAVTDGSKRTFDVALDKARLVDLLARLAKDFADTEPTTEEKQELLTKLGGLSITGKMTFDTKDALYSDTKLTIALEGSNESIIVEDSRKGDTYALKITSVSGATERFVLELTAVSQGKNTDFNGKAFVSLDGQEKIEVAKLSGKVEDNVLKTFNLSISALGMGGGELSYIQGEKLAAQVVVAGTELFKLENNFSGENFAGKLTIRGKDAANWSAEIQKKVLKALNISVVDMVTLSEEGATEKKIFELKLAKKEDSDMSSGQATVNLGDETITADVSLQVEPSKFGFIVENIKNTGNAFVSTLKKAQLFVTANERTGNKKIELPKEFVSYQEFMSALGINITSTLPAPMLDYDLSDEDKEADDIATTVVTE